MTHLLAPVVCPVPLLGLHVVVSSRQPVGDFGTVAAAGMGCHRRTLGLQVLIIKTRLVVLHRIRTAFTHYGYRS